MTKNKARNPCRKHDSRVQQTCSGKSSIFFSEKAKTSAINSINLITSNRNLFFMKKIFGLCILVIVLIVVSGCTSTPSAPANTTVATTEAVTEATTAIPSAIPTESATPVATIAAPATITTIETTIPATPTAVQTPLVTAKVIHIRNNTFVPPVTTVLPGTGITWINDDTANHAVKATGASAGMFNSGDIVSGTSWSNAFGANEVTITYADPKFPGMNGTIIVKKALTISDYLPAPVTTTA